MAHKRAVDIRDFEDPRSALLKFKPQQPNPKLLKVLPKPKPRLDLYDNFAANLDRFIKQRPRWVDISFESSEHDFDIYDPTFTSDGEQS